MPSFLTLALLFWLTPALANWGPCPNQCDCPRDDRGRRTTQCLQGLMVDPIPISQMDRQSQIIIISAPDDFPNHLTIGPIFQQFTKLEELHIVESNVPAIGKHSFWGVPTLLTLNLTRNNISNVLEYNFRGLANLVKLHLDDNRIESMPSGTFRHVPELRVLTLSKNRITELVPRLFLILGKLHELDLSFNPLTELNPEVFKDIQDLRVFRCRGCGLTNINTLIYRLLPNLNYLDLGDNDFKYISSDEFRTLHKLQRIFLDGNHLPVVLERTFGHIGYKLGQTDLQSISLARNRLAKVTATAFANLTTLKELDIGYNKLDRLDTETFQPLADSLRRLILSGNPLPMTEVKLILAILPKLRDLGLADMNLREIPLGFFINHEHIRELNLSGNHFTHLPTQIFSPIQKLQVLDLSRNRFTGLDERFLIRIETLRFINLHDNPWTCDLCHMELMIRRVNRTSLSPSLQPVVCAAPFALKGRQLGTLSRSGLARCIGGISYIGGGEDSANSSFLSNESRFGLIAAGASILLVLLIGSLLLAGIAYSRHHHAARYYTNEERLAKSKEQEAIFENQAAILGDNDDIKYKIVATTLEKQSPPPITKKSKKKVTICTIDGISKDPEMHTLTNGT